MLYIGNLTSSRKRLINKSKSFMTFNQKAEKYLSTFYDKMHFFMLWMVHIQALLEFFTQHRLLPKCHSQNFSPPIVQ